MNAIFKHLRYTSKDILKRRIKEVNRKKKKQTDKGRSGKFKMKKLNGKKFL